MVATAAAIAGLASTGIGIGKSLFGGSNAADTKYDILLQQLADTRQNSTNAQIAGANINRLATAGYDDGQGGGLRYDPATGTWHSTLGPTAQAAQTAADVASVGRNTTDMRQAQGANARADLNVARAQPLIDAAMRRYADFRPTTSDELSSLLTNQAADANTQAYRPIIQAITQAANRSSSNAGDQISQVGQKSSADLRRGMIEARLAGIQGAENINNQRRQGLAMDLGAATNAGTPNFQYPTITPSTNNKDMLAALTSRTNAAGYTSALGQQAVNSALGTSNTAAKEAAGAVPPNPLNNLELGLDSLSKKLGTLDTKKLGSWFGNSTPDYQIWNPDNPIGTDTLNGLTRR